MMIIIYIIFVMILIFRFYIYFHTSKGAEYCEIRSYDEEDANRIQYAVMHHFNRSDKQEIHRGLVQGLTETTPFSEQSGGDMNHMPFPFPAPAPAPAPTPTPTPAPVSTAHVVPGNPFRWTTVIDPNGRASRRRIRVTPPAPAPVQVSTAHGNTRTTGPINTNIRYCIRCGHNNYRRLCNTCYDIWSEYQNGDYKEIYCHHCGITRPRITYNNPICHQCQQNHTLVLRVYKINQVSGLRLGVDLRNILINNEEKKYA